MANNALENNDVQESQESQIGKLGDHLGTELFKELMEAGRSFLPDETRPPSEQQLMAGMSPAEGLKVVQQVLDKGVQETPELYRGAMI